MERRNRNPHRPTQTTIFHALGVRATTKAVVVCAFDVAERIDFRVFWVASSRQIFARRPSANKRNSPPSSSLGCANCFCVNEQSCNLEFDFFCPGVPLCARNSLALRKQKYKAYTPFFAVLYMCTRARLRGAQHFHARPFVSGQHVRRIKRCR